MINRIRRNKGDRVFDGINALLLLIVGVVTLYPFWNILVLSFNNALDTLRGGVYLWPRSFTLDNFKMIFGLPQLATAFGNSFLRTIIGSLLSVGSTAMLSYVISRRDFLFQKFLQRLFVITMYVSGGLIPIYFVIKGLGLLDNFLVYLIPMLLQPFYLLIARSYMDGLPASLQESAQIDGANDFIIFAKIVFPLSMPIIATILLFVAVDQWNAWFDTFIYTANEKLTTLQYELVKILSQSTASVKNDADLRSKLAGGAGVVSTPQSIRMAITIVATIPIVVVYPFVQKYFVHGMTLGAVKG